MGCVCWRSGELSWEQEGRQREDAGCRKGSAKRGSRPSRRDYLGLYRDSTWRRRRRRRSTLHRSLGCSPSHTQADELMELLEHHRTDAWMFGSRGREGLAPFSYLPPFNRLASIPDKRLGGSVGTVCAVREPRPSSSGGLERCRSVLRTVESTAFDGAVCFSAPGSACWAGGCLRH